MRCGFFGEDTVLIADANGWISLSQDTGQRLWHHTFTDDLHVLPVHAGSSWIFAFESGTVTAIETRSGKTLWKQPFSVPPDFLTGGPDQLLVAGERDTLFMIDPSNGRLIWWKKLEASVSVSPVFLNPDLIVVAAGNSLTAYRSNDGIQKWTRSFDITIKGRVLVWKNELFAIEGAHNIWSIDAKTGQTRWKRRTTEVFPGFSASMFLVAVAERHLFLSSSPNRLVALAREDGEIRSVNALPHASTACPLLTPNAVVFAQAPGGRQLIGFDNLSEVVFHKTTLPVEFEILAMRGSRILLQADDGRVSLNQARFPPADPFREHLAVKSKPPAKLVSVLWILIILPGGALTFGCLGKPRIPSTLMTSLLLFAMLVSTCAVCAATARMAWLVLCHESSHHLFGITTAAILLSPTLCLFGWYCFYWWQSCPRKRTEWDSAKNPETIRVLRDLVEEMGLPQRTIEKTGQSPAGPFISGISQHHFRIFLPPDLDARVINYSHNDPAIGRSLLRLVLSHELAHLRNGDMGYIPLLTAARQTLPLCLLLASLYALLVHAFGSTSMVSTLPRSMVGFMVTGGISLYFLLTLFLRARESLADATSTLFLSPSALKRLIQPSQSDDTLAGPLESFLFDSRLKSQGRRAVGDFVPRIVTRPLEHLRAGFRFLTRSDTVEQFQHDTLLRVRAVLHKKRTLSQPATELFLGVIAAGILAALVMSALAHFVTIDFMTLLLETRPAPNEPIIAGFLKASELWSSEHNASPTWIHVRTLVPLITSLLLAAVTVLPWHDGARTTARGISILFKLVFALLFALIVAGVVFTFASPSRVPFPGFPALGMSLGSLWLWSTLATLWFCGLLQVRERPPRLRARLIEFGIVFLVILCGAAITYQLLAGLSVLGKLIWWAAFSLVSVHLANFPLVRRWIGFDDYYDESFRSVRLLGVSRGFLEPHGANLPFSRRHQPWLVAYVIVVFAVPAWILAIALQQPLLDIDASRFERSRIQALAFAQLMEDAPSKIQADRAGFRKQLIHSLFAMKIFDPLGARSSTWLGATASAAVLLSSLFLLGVQSIWGGARAERVFKKAGSMALLFELLDVPVLQQTFQPFLKKAVGRSGLPVMDSAHVPLLLRTCQVIECARYCEEITIPPRCFQWVLSQASSQGGFGPKRTPTLQHTLAALRMARLTNLKMDSIHVHETWLRKQLYDCWRTRFFLDPSAWLRRIGLAVDGLYQVDGGVPKMSRLSRFGQRWLRETFRIWGASDQSTQDTRNLLLLSSLWPQHSIPVHDHLKHNWLPKWEKHLSSRNPERELQEIATSISLIVMLFPKSYRARASVVQVKDNLQKHWLRIR